MLGISGEEIEVDSGAPEGPRAADEGALLGLPFTL